MDGDFPERNPILAGSLEPICTRFCDYRNRRHLPLPELPGHILPLAAGGNDRAPTKKLGFKNRIGRQTPNPCRHLRQS